MTAPQDLTIEIPDLPLPPAWMVAARSYFADRFAPDCERIFLPARTVSGGRLRLASGTLRTALPPAPRRLGAFRRRAAERVPEGRRIVDLRNRLPSNWAHFLNNHLPLFFMLSDAIGLDWSEALLLVPEDTPPHIFEAAALFGLELWATDAPVEGPGVAFEMTPWIGQRAARADWVRLPRPLAALETALVTAPAARALPRRVFLSRKDTRVPQNGAEVSVWLAAHGYETVYAEDLPPADQFRLFRQAERMVAVHGAGLAPLLYCGPGAGPAELVEILPCGHVTDVYRAMAHQTGVRWIGVRGRLKPEYVRPAYDFSKRFTAFSLDGFEVDVAALEHAFEALGTAAETPRHV
jgi:hypothetical protein